MLHAHAQPTNLKLSTKNSTLQITDVTDQAAALEAYDGHERVWCGRDEERGLVALVGIHNTALGPALGGTRVWPHESFEAGMTDVLRLSRGMTYKAAVAGLPFGGGKAVIIADPKKDKTEALLEAYAEMLVALDGQYYTGEDVGLTLADADFIRERAPNISGTSKGGSGNPSPVTAEGVFLGLKAALAHKSGSDRLAGVLVAVQGLGSVGWSLCEKLHAEGAELVVADIDTDAVDRAANTFGARMADAGDILFVEADILAPCALGGLFSSDTIPQLKAGIIAGAANNQLARHEDARLLMERGILYAPDYVINAGGLMNVAAELAPGGYNREATMRKVTEIPRTLTAIFQKADAEKRPTNEVASDIAMARIADKRS
ncbi:Leu/Phe/Val dehydrogenase [Nitratireductor basaltis]|uniref:Leucine dehydrogenase n=1 Tax=Nitratireductor basaltis TaxID=472175 RepID=A0A084U6Y1_9HYPH|nr:Glu/Leu/Phe/Val dehydrogenase dimerization domain-containing protein [Nitratireductor basaltis]KFB08717.1 Leucine dehydrogenase [Nitratireductor basaltis]